MCSFVTSSTDDVFPIITETQCVPGCPVDQVLESVHQSEVFWDAGAFGKEVWYGFRIVGNLFDRICSYDSII